MKPGDVQHFSPATYMIMGFFSILALVSPANWLFQSRPAYQGAFTPDTAMVRTMTIRRGRQIELYILGWLLVEISAALVAPRSNGLVLALARLLPLFRVLEIMQATINMSVFDRLRLGDKPHYVSGSTRTLVLAGWNFLELLFCFGIVYSSLLGYISSAVHPLDGYYFSVITQLTIGYGDLAPLGVVRLLSCCQGCCGFMLVVVVIARLVALLPATQSVMGDD